MIAASALLDRARRLTWLAYCGRHSLVIYLSFFVPMAATRILLLKTGLVPDVGVMSLIVFAAAVTGPLVLNVLVRGTPLGFVYTRPAWARLDVAVRRKGGGGAVQAGAELRGPARP